MAKRNRRKLGKGEIAELVIGAVLFSVIMVSVRNCRDDQQAKREAWEEREEREIIRQRSREIQDSIKERLESASETQSEGG